MNNETLIRIIDSMISDLKVMKEKVKASGIKVIGFKGEALENSIRKIRDEIKFIENYFE